MVGSIAGLASVQLFGEHFLQAAQHVADRRRREQAQSLYESLAIDGAELVKDDIPGPILKSAANAPGIRTSARSHRRHDDGSQMLVEFIR
jgi:hypothetical protein